VQQAKAVHVVINPAKQTSQRPGRESGPDVGGCIAPSSNSRKIRTSKQAQRRSSDMRSVWASQAQLQEFPAGPGT
jgi:hypothetical protein